MDIVGIIKKSYRSYGTLFSDDFVAFLKESSQNHVSFLKLSIFSHSRTSYSIFFFSNLKIRSIDVDNNPHSFVCGNYFDRMLFVEEKPNQK